MSISRRRFLSSFLKGAGCFAVTATVPAVPAVLARTSDPHERDARELDASERYRFPQGLASGDPLPDAVMLWTRVERVDEATSASPIPLTVQVSRDETFSTVLLEHSVVAPPESDGTVRVFVENLDPGTTYYYRFAAPDGTTPSHVGRTRTAPAPDADVSVRFAVASCQAYEAGHFGAYRWLLEEQENSAEPRLDAVLHLGDFIYEALGYGAARTVPDFPDGGTHGEDGTGRHARTLADYRHLYKVYLSDPDLQEARARFPFINIWDDHEFTNDAWQSASTYDGGSEPAQQRKIAANRAWFEFIPAVLSDHPGSAGQLSHARDFTNATVENADFEQTTKSGLHPESNNRAAVQSMTIYRSFRWGRHMELTLTDTRSYRSMHPVPPEINRQIAGTDRYLTPLRVVEVFDAGRTYNGGNPPQTVNVGEQKVPNVRRDHPPGTMLGIPQKDWWKATMAASDATWRIWGHSVPTLPMRLDLGAVNPEAETVVFTTDTWDGYLTERRELMDFLHDRQITNIVSLSGDNHNSFAGVLSRTYDDPDGAPLEKNAVGAEFSVCGISSPSVFQALVQAVDADSPLRPLVTHDARATGGAKQEETLNLTFLHGARSAVNVAQTGDLDQALSATNDAQNPHLRYVDSNAYGLAIVTVAETGVDAEFVTMPPPVDVPRTDVPAPLRRTHFHVPAWGAGDVPDLEGPNITGRPPFPLSEQ